MKVKTDGFFTSGQGKDIRLSDGHTYNLHAFSVSRATAPGFPVSIEIETTDNAKIEFTKSAISKVINETTEKAAETKEAKASKKDKNEDSESSKEEK